MIETALGQKWQGLLQVGIPGHDDRCRAAMFQRTARTRCQSPPESGHIHLLTKSCGICLFSNGYRERKVGTPVYRSARNDFFSYLQKSPT
jgi:hypothetical protein